jgi:small subunit ribosomal protein S1
MGSEDDCEGRGRPGGPPPMDEGWWQAVLQEGAEGRPATDNRRGSFSPERGLGLGSAEDWSWARQLYEADDTIELNVIGHNRGGLLVEARSLRGFVPISHIIDFMPASSEHDRIEQLKAIVGQRLCLKVIEFDPERGRLVFSQRAALAGPGRRTELLNRLCPGERVSGQVTNITAFGAFVDLGGVEGLIHVSELSWGRVRHPEDVVCCGQEIEVMVLSVDPEQARVALSLKELLPDPWLTVEERYSVGDVVEGEITNVVKFGAFVGIEEGLEGLIHISEMGDGAAAHPGEMVREGERVRVRIVNISAGARRLGLSLKQVESWDQVAGPHHAPDHQHEALSSY